MWALPAPQTILTIGMTQELFHPISNCDDSQRMSSKSHNRSWYANVRRGKAKILNLFKNHIDPPHCVNDWTYNGVYILST